MIVGVVGSRSLTVNNLGDFLPDNTTEICSGGAVGIDTCAREYAEAHGIKLTEFLPRYDLYGRGAPLRRNLEIIRHSDIVLAFHAGSRGTQHVINNCKKMGVPVKVFVPDGAGSFTQM